MKLNFPLWIFSIDFFQTPNWLLSNSVTSIIEFLRLGKGPFIYYVGRFWNIFWPIQSQCNHDLCTDSEQKMLFSEPVQSLRIIYEWSVHKRRQPIFAILRPPPSPFVVFLLSKFRQFWPPSSLPLWGDVVYGCTLNETNVQFCIEVNVFRSSWNNFNIESKKMQNY